MSQYRAYSQIYPFPHEQICIQLAFLQASVINVITAAFGGKKQFTIKDFYIDYRENYEEKIEEQLDSLSDEVRDRQSKQMEIALMAAFAATGAKIDVIKQTSSGGNGGESAVQAGD